MRTTVWLLVVLTGACGAVTLFEDDFDDGNADGWTEYSTQPDSTSYYVDEGRYHMEISTASGFAFAFSGDEEGASFWHMSVPDYSLICRTRAYPNTQHVGVAVRWQQPYSDEIAYVLWLRYLSSLVSIYRHDGVSNYAVLDTAPFAFEFNTDYCVRLEIYGGLIRAKIWQGDLPDEPEAFLVSANDGTYSEPGSIGIGCQGFESEFKHAAFD